jgi:hypothetical protein
MPFVGSIIDGTPEYIQHASIDMSTFQSTKAVIEFLRVPASQVPHRPDIQLP